MAGSAAAVQVRFVHVAGCLGVGKSSLVERVEAAPAAFIEALRSVAGYEWLRTWPDDALVLVTHEEPQRWKTAEGISLLDLKRADPVKYAFEFQKTVLLDRLRAAHDAVFSLLLHKDATHVLVVTDGCVNTDADVYARACYEAQQISEPDWRLYREVYEKVERNWPQQIVDLSAQQQLAVDISIAGTLLLCTSLDETKRRIANRDRVCERDLPDDYLNEIIGRHEFAVESSTYAGGPVTRIVDTPRGSTAPFVVIKDPEW